MLNPTFFDASDLFAHLIYPRTRTLVISDSEYQKMKQERAKENIKYLEDKIDQLSDEIIQIKKANNLLPNTTED